MLEFYYNYHRKFFKSKCKQLADELTSVLKIERVKVVATEQPNIPAEYEKLLGKELFCTLNNLYFSIRSSDSINHPLLRKYLPETRQEPNGILFADFFNGAGGLSQGLINAG